MPMPSDNEFPTHPSGETNEADGITEELRSRVRNLNAFIAGLDESSNAARPDLAELAARLDAHLKQIEIAAPPAAGG